MLERLRIEQDRFDIIQRKWFVLVKVRTSLINKWREKYENPIDNIMKLRFNLKKNDKNYQEKYDALTIECEELIQIRRDSEEAKELRKKVDQAVKSVAKFLPVYENAGIKFRLLRKEFMAAILGKHYD